MPHKTAPNPSFTPAAGAFPERERLYLDPPDALRRIGGATKSTTDELVSAV
jgi:hypothetical protein